MTDTTDYQMRAKEYDFASDDAIRTALLQSGTIILDVRTKNEIIQNGKVTDLPGFISNNNNNNTLIYIQSDCTPDDCYTLRTDPQSIIPNMSNNNNNNIDTTKDTTIILHCASGRRATRAKALLLDHGYQGPILNAGGFSDIQRFF